jgi:RNA polymerase sigma-70 factor (ECF subfamily)
VTISSTPRETGAASDAKAGGRFQRFTSTPNSQTESDMLLRRAIAATKAGDVTALHFLYVRYADDVRGYVQSIVREPHDAEDITQNVFAKLSKAILKYEQREVPFAAWILRVARNVAVDHMRARRAIPCEEVRELYPQHDDDSSDTRALTLRDALAALPDEQREVIMLRHVVGLSPGEIGEKLGRTEPSVHGLHHRGRGALRSALTEMDCGPTVRAKVAA